MTNNNKKCLSYYTTDKCEKPGWCSKKTLVGLSNFLQTSKMLGWHNLDGVLATCTELYARNDENIESHAAFLIYNVREPTCQAPYDEHSTIFTLGITLYYRKKSAHSHLCLALKKPMDFFT